MFLKFDISFEAKNLFKANSILIFQLVNTEMFWVVTEISSEHNLIRRSKMIKQFIKVARK